MPFDWNNYFTLAEQLATRDDEASKRTSVSRAYYAAFHDAMIRVERNFGAKQGGTSHDWCWNKYMYSRDDSCYQVAINGNRLKAKRVKADYDAATIERLTEYTARAIDDARRLKQQIAALDTQFPRL